LDFQTEILPKTLLTFVHTLHITARPRSDPGLFSFQAKRAARTLGVEFGSTRRHPEAQWLLRGLQEDGSETQHLSPEEGKPRLRELLEGVKALMRISTDWDDYSIKLDIAFPKYDEALALPFDGGLPRLPKKDS
jgi:hypothetical protein